MKKKKIHLSNKNAETGKEKPKPKIVGIGASAGGLAALRSFFEALPDVTGMSFVVVMHLSPKHESNLAELLQAKTKMKVIQVTGKTNIVPNHVYVIPPNKLIEASDHELSLFDFEKPRTNRSPIDLFFKSIAVAHGDGVAIILSGGGSDGIVGAKAMKEAGGLILVQDPDEAEFDSMPSAAIETGMVDMVLPVREMAERLVEIKQISYRLHEKIKPDDEKHIPDLQKILTQIRVRTGHDFTNYKHPSLLRRIHRRMKITSQVELPDYIAYLRENPSESQELFKDLLIGVTNFFRDPEAFEMVKEKIIPKVFEGKNMDDTVRVWVVGCSSGEEAYSVAILLHEYASTLDERPKIQVFATDIDIDSLNIARQGLYPASIKVDVEPKRLKRFFEKRNSHYQIISKIRESVLFSDHSVFRDPPFSRLDLITCRNFLIYLQRKSQEQIFSTFNYALRQQGYLFLGSSETVDGASELFQTMDKQHRIYQAKQRNRLMLNRPTFLSEVRQIQPAEKRQIPRHSDTDEDKLHHESLEENAPPSLLVDENHHVIHLSERAGRFLQHPGGKMTNDVTRLVRSEFQRDLNSGLFHAFEAGRSTVARLIKANIDGNLRHVFMTIKPVQRRDDARRLALVMFNEADEENDILSEEGPENLSDQRLKEELLVSRRRMQLLLEKFESSKEEMQTQNEELLSINEEYKATMEELETSKEEIESINEELETVNNELKGKIKDVTQAHSDINNLMTSTDIAVLFLDRDLQIKLYTPQAREFLNVQESDRGRPITHLTHKFNYPELEEDSRSVITNLTQIEREIKDHSGRWYLVRVRPYRTTNDQIDGVVIAFVDITELKGVEQSLKEEKDFAELLFDTVREGLLVLDDDFCVKSGSESFYHLFQTKPDVTEGKLLFDLGNKQWDVPELRNLLEKVLPERKAINDFEIEHEFEQIGHRVMLLNARQIDHLQLILLAIEDVTERKNALKEVKKLNETLEERVEERTRQLSKLARKLTMAEQKERSRIASVLHDDLQQVLVAIQLDLKLLQKKAEKITPDQLKKETVKINELAENALKQTRDLTGDLNPNLLKSRRLEDLLNWLSDRFKTMNNLQTELVFDRNLTIPTEEKCVVILQILRELLLNIVKHSGTDKAVIKVTGPEKGNLVIRIIDDGEGFDMEKVKAEPSEKGYGLSSIRDRLKIFDGSMDIDSKPGSGTRVEVRLPIE